MTNLNQTKIDFGALLARAANFVFGTTSSRLMLLGIGLISFGWKDILLYAFQTMILKKASSPPPGSSFGTIEILGVALLVMGLLIPFYRWITAYKKNLRAEKVKFKAGHLRWSDAKIQDGLEHLYGIKDANVLAARQVLGHKTNVDKFLKLFKYCHNNVVWSGQSFSLKDQNTGRYHTIGFVLWLVFPIHIVLCGTLLTGILLRPQAFASVSFEWQTLLALMILETIGAAMFLIDLSRMGSAVTFVKEF
ncbi:hypothetical protein LRS56_10610 [Pseudomonas poae]|nr:hypothetical protein LRS56_10610 [Pseudomonas poae]